MTKLYIGLMTGTSLDGVDAALIAHHHGDYHYLDHVECPLPAELRAALFALCEKGENELERAALAAWQHADISARAVAQLLAKNHLSRSEIVAIGSHGQTVRHAPEHAPPFTIQLQNPARLAELTGIDVVADFRARDVAAGGQGAPLAPLFQRGLLGVTTAIVINIGGIANVSFLQKNQMTGYDTGPGNGLLDSWIGRHLQQNFDDNGAWARRGKIIDRLLIALKRDPFFQLSPPKSSGRDYFHLDWLSAHLLPEDRPEDVQRTLLELTAQTIAMAILAQDFPENCPVFLAGGGAKNGFLQERIAACIFPHRLQKLPFPEQALEAAGFAWLAAQFVARQPLDLQAVTGGKKRILGALYPS